MATVPEMNVIHRRKQERDHLTQLNSRFASYMTRVHTVQEQTRSIENATLNAHTAALDAEVEEIRDLYEKELEYVRSQLSEAVKGRSENELSASSHIVLSTDLDKKLSQETNSRKKLEVALGDSHRLLNEKEASFQEAQMTISELQHAHVDTQTDRDALRTQLHSITTMYDAEAATRHEREATIQSLTDQMAFADDKHTNEVRDLQHRLRAGEAAIKISEERLKEHDVIDEQLSANMAKVKMQSHDDFVRYTEESEHSFNASLQSMKHQLENAVKELEKSRRENIHCARELEEMRARCLNTEAKCASAEDANKSLIHTMELERQEHVNNLEHVEKNNRDLEQTVNNKIRELNIERSAQMAVDGELDGLSGMIEAGEHRLSISQMNPAPEIISKTSIRRPLTAGRFLPPIAPLPPVSRRVSMVGAYPGVHPGAYPGAYPGGAYAAGAGYGHGGYGGYGPGAGMY